MDIRIIPISGTDKLIIFRPLAGLAFVGNRAMVDLALRLAAAPLEQPGEAHQGALDHLAAIGFFQPDPPVPTPLDTAWHPAMAVLLLTNQCQLRCTYCYAAAGESTRYELPAELGYAAIDHVCQNAQDRGLEEFEVSFHGGGEPTYNWTVLKQCTLYARQKPLKAQITLTSNGIWSTTQCDWVIANLNGLSLSVDGSPATQNRQRPLSTGRDSFPYTIHTMNALDRHHFPYGVRMTATAPWTLADDVAFLCQETGCHSIQVEPAFNIKRGGHNEPSEEEITAYVEAFVAAHAIAAQAGRQLSYSGARAGMVTTTFCTAPYDALVVNAHAEIVACYEITGDSHPLMQLSVIGRIEDGAVVIDSAMRERLHTLMNERRQTCQDCFCYWSCAGDCYARTFRTEPDGHLQRRGRCQINQMITERLLLGRIADGGGVWIGTRVPIPSHG